MLNEPPPFYLHQFQQPFIQTNSPPQPNQQRREIGDQAIWTLSSAKAGNGVDQLRDDNPNTFWQSDGTQPHFINIQFLRKMRVQEIAIQLDFKQDESYTPNKISIRAGTSLQDLKEIILADMKEPCGWYVFPLKTKSFNGAEKYTPSILPLPLGPSSPPSTSRSSSSRTSTAEKIPTSAKSRSSDPESTFFSSSSFRKQNQGMSFPDFKSPELT